MKWRSFVRISWPLRSEDPWFKAPDTNWRDWTATLPCLKGTVDRAGVAKGGKIIWTRNREVWEEKRPEKLAEFEGREL
jgi:hypothetical protein